MTTDQIEDFEIGSNFDEKDFIILNENLSDIPLEEIKIRLFLMEIPMDFSTNNRWILDVLYKKEIKNQIKRNIIKSYLFDNYLNENSHSRQKTNMIRNKRER